MNEIVLMAVRTDRVGGDEGIRTYCLREYGVENCLWSECGEEEKEEEREDPLPSAPGERRGGPLQRLLGILGIAPRGPSAA